MQADSPFSNDKKRDKKATESADDKAEDEEDEAPRCPPVRTDSRSSCSSAPPADLIACRSDDDCASFSDRKCCHDGCRLVCLTAVPAPPCTCVPDAFYLSGEVVCL